MDVRFLACGDTGLTVEFAQDIDPHVNQRVLTLAHMLRQKSMSGVTDIVPTYCALTVIYDPIVVRAAELTAEIEEMLAQPASTETQARSWRIPVVYGAPAGVDLAPLAHQKAMSVDALIDLHSSAVYRVFMIGFAPGFAYLGGLPEPLHTPRRSTVRQHVPAGAIGIGGQQASVNSVPGPSGWHYIGQTPWTMFDPQRQPPVLLSPGDTVRFEPITEQQADGFMGIEHVEP